MRVRKGEKGNPAGEVLYQRKIVGAGNSKAIVSPFRGWGCAEPRGLTRLLNCQVRLGERWLEFRSGGWNGSVEPAAEFSLPWVGKGIAEYDRMSVLLSEAARSSMKFAKALNFHVHIPLF